METNAVVLENQEYNMYVFLNNWKKELSKYDNVKESSDLSHSVTEPLPSYQTVQSTPRTDKQQWLNL